MALEIEAKIKVADFEGIRRRLEALSACFESAVVQVDTFYDGCEGGLRDAGCGLRVRRERAGSLRRSLLTYKGPRHEGPYKVREEIEFGVGDASLAGQLLERLGMSRVLVVEKQRQVARVERCQVCLDEVKGLGRFVEIEGPSVEAVSQVRSLLGLSEAPVIQQAYATLLSERGLGTPSD